jgi:hypothetical protein
VTAPGRALSAFGLKRESYDHVMVNPPFYEEGSVRAAPDSGRATAHVMQEDGLAAWIRFCAGMAAPGAQLTLIDRPGALGELLRLLAGRFGGVVVFPLFPRRDEPAARILVQAKKGSRAGLSLWPGLVLQQDDGCYTDAAEAVLRGGQALGLGASGTKRAAASGGEGGGPARSPEREEGLSGKQGQRSCRPCLAPKRYPRGAEPKLSPSFIWRSSDAGSQKKRATPLRTRPFARPWWRAWLVPAAPVTSPPIGIIGVRISVCVGSVAVARAIPAPARADIDVRAGPPIAPASPTGFRGARGEGDKGKRKRAHRHRQSSKLAHSFLLEDRTRGLSAERRRQRVVSPPLN